MPDAPHLPWLENRPASLGRMFFDRVEATPDREAYRFPEAGGWRSLSWQETGRRVRSLAAGLVALGIEPEQRVAIASGTRFEWVAADLAIMSAGAATTTVYPSSIPDDVAFILGDSESRIVFAEDDTQIAKLRDRRADLPALRTLVTFDGTPDGDWVISLADLERRGEQLLAESPEVVSGRVDGTEPDQLATLIYTSGTTGRPKGVRLSHAAWTYEGVAVQELDLLSIDDLQFLWLPLAHAFGKVLLTAQLAIGFSTAIDGRIDKIIENLGVVKPTFMGAAPRIFEKAHGRVTTTAAEAGGARAWLAARAFDTGQEVARRRASGTDIPVWLAVQHRILDALVLAKVRARFGGRIRFFVSGSAALNRDIAEWFVGAGLPILEGYGLTETSAGSALNRPHNFRLGAVGQPLAGTEMRVADDGELLIRGPGVMDGYHNLEEETAATIVDGWLHTGDMGKIDGAGFVTVTDRKKDLFKTSGGKYVAPQVIEGAFKALCPYVSHVVVHGDQRNFVSALVTLDPESIGDWAAREGLGGKAYAEIASSEAARSMVGGYVERLNRQLNRWESIKRFVILDHDLTVEAGEVTPSMKVRRRAVEERYHSELDSLYS